MRQAGHGIARLEQGGSAGTAAVVLAANNPLATTEVLGTVTVVTNNTCLTAPTRLPRDAELAIQRESKAETESDSAETRRPDQLVAVLGQRPEDGDAAKLSETELSCMALAAIDRWSQTGISLEDLARLRQITFEFADLPDGQLAVATSERIILDETAAGYGWYFDQSPFEDSEFDLLVPNRELQTTDLSLAHGRMDLLTVVMRQLGQVYLHGKDRIPRSTRRNLRPLMQNTLSPAVRRLPLDQLRTTLSPTGSIRTPASERIVAQSSAPAQSNVPQTSNNSAGRQVEKTARIPSDARYASVNPATDQAAWSDPALKPAVLNIKDGNAAKSYTANGARRVAAFTPSMSGETVNLGPFTIPPGESVMIMFNVTINNPLPAGVCSVSNQGTITADGGISILTDDPAVAGAANPTVTPIVTVPTITCPANITTDTDPGVCTATETFAPTAVGCPVPTVVCVPASGFAFPKGVTTVTCTASNGQLPDATCTFTVTVNDNQAPTITCPANVTVSTDPGVCTAVVNYTVPSPVDNCPGATVACLPNTGATFPKGATTVTCTVTDAGGLTANCTFTVTVNDTQPPTITCPANITTPRDEGQCAATVTYPAPTVSDNCPGVGSPVCAPASGSSFPVGTTTVTCTVSDAATPPNTSTCTFTVTFTDTQPPTITCPANISMTGNVPTPVTYPTPTPNDNCPGVNGVPACKRIDIPGWNDDGDVYGDRCFGEHG